MNSLASRDDTSPDLLTFSVKFSFTFCFPYKFRADSIKSSATLAAAIWLTNRFYASEAYLFALGVCLSRLLALPTK